LRVDTALLCDWATVREGLLHILGGGITRIWRSEFPAPLGACLAVRVALHPTEATGQHEIQVLLLGEDGSEVARIDGQFSVSEGDTAPGEEVAMAIPMPMPAVGIEKPGAYSFEILIDGIHHASVPFRADYAANKPGGGQ
jgi:hypothetical protein